MTAGGDDCAHGWLFSLVPPGDGTSLKHTQRVLWYLSAYSDNYIFRCTKIGICHYVNTRVYIMAQTSRLAEKSAIADSSDYLINLNH